MEKVFSCNTLPKNLEEMKKLDNYDLKDPFTTAYLTVLALVRYPEDKEAGVEMLNELKGPSDLSVLDIQFIDDRFMDGKDYLAKSYLEGTSPENNYTVSAPYIVKVEDNPYSYTEEGYATLYLRSSGADSLRSVKLRNKPSTGEWFIWSFEGLLSGIRMPVKEDKWA